MVLAVHCSLLLVFILPAGVSADNPKEQYHKIQKEMETHREKFEQAKRREKSVLEDLDGMSRRLSEIEVDLKKQQRRVRQTEAEINKVEKDIALAKAELEKKKKWLKMRLKAMQRYGQTGDIVFLLAATDDVAGLMRRWRYLEEISLKERKGIEEYGDNLKKLDEKERELQSLRADLKRGEERIRLTEASLAEKKNERETLLASVRKEKSTHEKLYRELQESARRLLEVIKKLEEKETYEGKGFPALKGSLSWPVNGKVAIPYGSQKDPKFNTPVFRNGIYIKTDDESVKAVYSGKVVFADWFKGYGNLVIINHGEGYHTLYGNLSETFLKVGDIIKGKDAIGKVGESGMLNAPSLYFEVRFKGKPLDPLQWLRRK
jgi:septal ring factor EnvC (AmiA/AmiB activator)